MQKKKIGGVTRWGLAHGNTESFRVTRALQDLVVDTEEARALTGARRLDYWH